MQLMENLNTAVMENEQLAESILEVFVLMFSARKLAVENMENTSTSLRGETSIEIIVCQILLRYMKKITHFYQYLRYWHSSSVYKVPSGELVGLCEQVIYSCAGLLCE